MTMRDLVNEQIVSASGKVLGVITNQYQEGATHWVVVNDTYEVNATECEYVLDLMGTLRALNPELHASFVRLLWKTADEGMRAPKDQD